MNDKKVRGLSGATILTLVVFLFVMLWFTNQFDQKEEEITWKEFEELAAGKDIEKIVVTQNKNVPTGRVELRLKDQMNGESEKYLYVSDVNVIQEYLQEKDLEYEMPDVREDSWFVTVVMPVLLTLMGVMLIFAFMNRQGGGANAKAMNFGKSRARLSMGGDKKITFSQVAGLKEEKEEIYSGRSAYPERSAFGGSSGNRKDIACESGCRRSGCAVLHDIGFGFRRDVRRCRRVPCQRPV